MIKWSEVSPGDLFLSSSKTSFTVLSVDTRESNPDRSVKLSVMMNSGFIRTMVREDDFITEYFEVIRNSETIHVRRGGLLPFIEGFN